MMDEGTGVQLLQGDATIQALADKIAELEYDRDAASVRGNDQVARLLEDEMAALYRVLMPLVSRLWISSRLYQGEQRGASLAGFIAQQSGWLRDDT